ncbi:hypothetical protein [Amycolatopsis sp. NPDC051102]|uniref:hypothetical protein n=1 Tax=Amycolatopsis sp. NPDC051102 TaxID=3155163 RepID=UPI00343A872F
MRMNQFWPCVVVAGDRLALVSRRVVLIMILIWFEMRLAGKELLPALFVALAGVGISIDCGARFSLVLKWDLSPVSGDGTE